LAEAQLAEGNSRGAAGETGGGEREAEMATEQTVAFDDASEGGGSPVEPGRYHVKVIRLEPGQDFGNGPTIRWVFHLADAASKAILRDPEGEAYEFFQLSSTKLSGRSKPRQWAEALLGRSIENGESGALIAHELQGRKGVALIANNEQGYPRILQLDPLKGDGAAASKPEPKKPAEEMEF
jgi:hypothetical protein